MNKNSYLKTSSMLILSLFSLLAYTGCANESYEDCILNNVKGVTDKQALTMIRNACREKTAAPIPKKCRDISEENTALFSWEKDASEREKCITKCKESGWWDKTFGSCSTYF